jgi:dipeptidyl aminopeptidase/acylaminoacyl peptidase
VANKTLCAAALSFIIVLPFGSAASARQAKPAASRLETLTQSLSAGRHYSQVAVSPGGDAVAWIEHGRGRRKATPRASGIYVANLRAQDREHVHFGSGSDLAWSPNGKDLAFLAGRGKEGGAQVCVKRVNGDLKQLTDLKGSLARPKWSPDGRKIAFLFIENATRGAGPLGPVPAKTGLIDETSEEQRLAIVDVASGETRVLSPPDFYVYEFDWSPDSSGFVITAAHGSGDNNWYIAQIYALSTQSEELKVILDPKMQIGVPRWSPDGKTIAFIGGLMSDEGFIGGDIYTVPASGGTPRNLTQGMKASATWLAWIGSSSRIIFAEDVDGRTGIATVEAESGKINTLWTGAETFSATIDAYGPGIALSRDGSVSALVRQSYSQPPEVWAGSVGQWEPLTHHNEGLKPLWGEAKSLHWPSDEWTIQGWLLYPYQFNPNRRYPMIVVPHGGPTGCVTPRWPGSSHNAVLSHEGYFVFLPNFRGSTGQGEKFVRANVRDFGHGDLRDIMTGVDEVLRTNPVDPERLGITGGSYGGYMTMWTVTQTNRFRAAVAAAGISNWQSYYGQNGIDQWMIPFFGASVYDDPAVYAKSSPINFIKNVKTPTLVVVGEHDIECPVPQSYEFYRALKRHGVPTQLVVYPGEGHGFSQPKHRQDELQRLLEWFDKYLKEAPRKE